ncbi:hypothetical protein QP162_19005 [Sphingomonas aurantiaca]|uniref:hypothetical protein n=1 Tax=Sphingomonas aurantiaca TaxID=185949 RepID=UPI002FE07DDF
MPRLGDARLDQRHLGRERAHRVGGGGLHRLRPVAQRLPRLVVARRGVASSIAWSSADAWVRPAATVATFASSCAAAGSAVIAATARSSAAR